MALATGNNNKMSTSSPEKICFVIVGPTAVGKTEFAISLAEHLKTSIISADSRQCYKELNIGVARPTPQELAKVPHFFIASHSIKENLSVIDFEQYALQKAEEVFKKSNYLVVVGGTGLYVKAFCDGLDDIPAADLDYRNELNDKYEKKGLSWLQETIKEKDPLFFKEGEMENPRRILRALEVMHQTNKSILTFHEQNKKERPFKIIKIGLDLPRELLYKKINNRVYDMIKAGFIIETEKLLPYWKANALQTVGYKEIFDFLDHKLSLERTIELIKQNTRKYAKRQLTWFKKDESVIWFDAYDKVKVLREVLKMIGE